MYTDYANPIFLKLRDELLQSGDRDRLVTHAAQAEHLLGEIDPGQCYSYSSLCSRISEHFPSPSRDTTVSGEAVQHDLRRLIEDLSDAAGVRARDAGEPVHTIDELSKMFDVSTKTISRWREQGLVARWFVFERRKRIGFLRSSVERFVAKNRDRVRRANRFRHLSPAEHSGVIEQARRLAASGLSSTEVIKRIARTAGRSIETIRYTLKRHDREQPANAILYTSHGKLSDEVKDRIYQQHRRGASMEGIARNYGRATATIQRVISEFRCQRIFELPLDYIYNREFDHAGAEERILAPMPQPKRRPKTVKAPSDVPAYLASLYDTPLLTREQEQHLFRKYNYLKYSAVKLRDHLDPAGPKIRLMDRIESLYQQAVETKNQIVQANLRLVISLVKKRSSSAGIFYDLVSDGNISLMRAVDKFDYSRGFKVSTYAHWAIIRNFARTIPEEHRQHGRFHTSQEELIDDAADYRGNEYREEAEQAVREGHVNRILSCLNDREQKIIAARYGLAHFQEPQTLKAIGAKLGVTKERVRQIEARALNKLRWAALQEGISLLN